MKNKLLTLLALCLTIGSFNAKAVSPITPDPLMLSNWDATYNAASYAWTNTKTLIVDPDNALNHIIKLDRNPTVATYQGMQWANSLFTAGVPFGLTSASQYRYIVVKAKKSTAYDIKVKLEQPQTGTLNVVTLTSINASVAGQWVTYIFDAGVVNNTNKLFGIFPEFGGNTGAVTTYIDDIYFTNTLPAIDFSSYKFPLNYTTGTGGTTVTKTYDIARTGTGIDITLLNTQPIPGATSYNVYDGATLLTSTYDAAKNVIKIIGLTRGTTYNLQIAAVNASSVESAKSDIITFNTRSNTGTGYEVMDDFEGGNLGWTTYGNPSISATATNPLTTGINTSAKCISVAVTTGSNYYAMAILPNEKILAGSTTNNYRYLHAKMKRPSQATGTVVLKLEKGGGQVSTAVQEIISISTAYNDDVWHDYVFDLGAAAVTNESYYRQFDFMPNKLASGNQTAAFTIYIDDIYLSNDATLSTSNLSTVNIPVTITTSGSIASATGARGYLSGDMAVVTAIPNSNWRFTNWTLGSAAGTVMSTSPTYSFPVSASTSLYANSIATWTYTATSSDVTKGTVSGTGVYDVGAAVTLIATPTTGYSFVNWADGSVGGTSASTSASYAFTSGTAHKNYFANFAINTYAIAASANDVSMGSVTGSATYNYGASVSLVATPSSGFHFINWTEGTTEVSTSASYTFTVSTARSLVANFSFNTGLNQLSETNLVTVKGRNIQVNVAGEVQIYNNVGRLMISQKVVDTPVLLNSAGIYVVKMLTSQGIKVQKIVVY